MKFLKLDDGLAADGQQALGQVVGVGAHAFAFAGDREDDFHLCSIPISVKDRKKGIAGCGVQDARGVADAPPRKIRKFRIYVKFDEIDQENSGPTIQFSPKIGF